MTHISGIDTSATGAKRPIESLQRSTFRHGHTKALCEIENTSRVMREAPPRHDDRLHGGKEDRYRDDHAGDHCQGVENRHCDRLALASEPSGALSHSGGAGPSGEREARVRCARSTERAPSRSRHASMPPTPGAPC